MSYASTNAGAKTLFTIDMVPQDWFTRLKLLRDLLEWCKPPIAGTPMMRREIAESAIEMVKKSEPSLLGYDNIVAMDGAGELAQALYQDIMRTVMIFQEHHSFDSIPRADENLREAQDTLRVCSQDSNNLAYRRVLRELMLYQPRGFGYAIIFAVAIGKYQTLQIEEMTLSMLLDAFRRDALFERSVIYSPELEYIVDKYNFRTYGTCFTCKSEISKHDGPSQNISILT